jgi:alpha-D-ribose 1-methylphosphonate 5-triphosphate synthase subunit PhnL
MGQTPGADGSSHRDLRHIKVTNCEIIHLGGGSGRGKSTSLRAVGYGAPGWDSMCQPAEQSDSSEFMR